MPAGGFPCSFPACEQSVPFPKPTRCKSVVDDSVARELCPCPCSFSWCALFLMFSCLYLPVRAFTSRSRLATAFDQMAMSKAVARWICQSRRMAGAPGAYTLRIHREACMPLQDCLRADFASLLRGGGVDTAIRAEDASSVGYGARCGCVAGRKSKHVLQWYTGRVSLSEASLPDADPRGNGHPSLGASYSVVGNARSAA